MNFSQAITGMSLIAIGIFLIGLSFFIDNGVVSVIYGLISLLVGLLIFFNTMEDKIEQIKKRKRG